MKKLKYSRQQTKQKKEKKETNEKKQTNEEKETNEQKKNRWKKEKKANLTLSPPTPNIEPMEQEQPVDLTVKKKYK